MIRRVAKAAVLAGQCKGRLRQLVFVVALGRLIALRSTGLTHQLAGVLFTESFVPSVLDGAAASLGT